MAMEMLEGRQLKKPDSKASNKPSEFVSLQEITDLVKVWNRQNPSYHIDPLPRLIDEELPMQQR